MSNKDRSVARSSMLMASGTIISRVLGFARTILLAAAIGVTTDAADAFGVANQLPNNVYAIIVTGLLNAVLIPQLVKARSNKDGGKGYVDRLLTLILSVFLVVTLAATIASPWLVSLYTSGWNENQLALATAFAYWCLPQLFFYGLYSLLGEVLNSRSVFGPYMWAPVLNNIVSMVGLVVFVVLFGLDPTGKLAIDEWTASQIAVLSGTATLGVASQAIILLWAWKRADIKFSLNFKFRGFGLRPALKAASWSLGMVVVTQIGGVVQTIVASQAISARAENAAVASVAVAAVAWLIFMVPHSVVTVSVATAYFTKMAQHAHENKMDLFKKDFSAGLRAISVFAVFFSVAMIVLAYPMSRVFIGQFDATISLGNVLIAFMIGLLPFSFVYMMQRAFYALENTRTPFVFTVIQISIYVAGAIVISNTVEAKWLVVALSLLTSSTVTLQAIIAFTMLTKRIGSLNDHKIASALSQFVLAGVIAGAMGYGAIEIIGGIKPGSFAVASVLSSSLTIAGVGFLMFAIYTIALRLLRVPEIDTALAGFKGILRR
jgi:putative peptidoglycan lipid II flippase